MMFHDKNNFENTLMLSIIHNNTNQNDLIAVSVPSSVPEGMDCILSTAFRDTHFHSVSGPWSF